MNKTIEQFVDDLSQLLLEKSLVIASAESCTGGLIAASITDRPGSSHIFDRGFVTYSNQSKIDMLCVSENILNNYGAVSPQCAHAMAEGAIKNSLADLSISVTGIAGPDGGSAEKPLGLIYFGIASKKNQTKTYECHFNGHRHSIRLQSLAFALKELCRYAGEYE